jgi:hypothetical protein
LFNEKYFFKKLLSKLSIICLLLVKLINKKYFLVKKNLPWFPEKYIFFYFGQKTLFKSYEKFKNILLLVDYNKFDLQTFNCYIYCFELFFQFHPLKFNLI